MESPGDWQCPVPTAGDTGCAGQPSAHPDLLSPGQLRATPHRRARTLFALVGNELGAEPLHPRLGVWALPWSASGWG